MVWFGMFWFGMIWFGFGYVSLYLEFHGPRYSEKGLKIYFVLLGMFFCFFSLSLLVCFRFKLMLKLKI